MFVGLYRLRHCRPALILLGAALTLFVCVSAVAPGVSLWPYLSPFLPAAGALRAVSRLALLLLIPAALCAAWAVKGLSARRPWLTLVLVVLSMLEQGRTLSGFDRDEHRQRVRLVAGRVPGGTRVFLVTPTVPLKSDAFSCELHLDAMWASLETGVPTVNGYSGKMPPGWTFEEVVLHGPTDERDVESLLHRWLAPFNLAGKIVAVAPGRSEVRVLLVPPP